MNKLGLLYTRSERVCLPLLPCDHVAREVAIREPSPDVEYAGFLVLDFSEPSIMNNLCMKVSEPFGDLVVAFLMGDNSCPRMFISLYSFV